MEIYGKLRKSAGMHGNLPKSETLARIIKELETNYRRFKVLLLCLRSVLRMHMYVYLIDELLVLLDTRAYICVYVRVCVRQGIG